MGGNPSNGEEEFVVHLPDGDEDGTRAGEKIQRAFSEIPLPELDRCVRTSIGLAVLGEHASDPAALVRAADRDLYIPSQGLYTSLTAGEHTSGTAARAARCLVPPRSDLEAKGSSNSLSSAEAMVDRKHLHFPSPPYSGPLHEAAPPVGDSVRVSFACPYCGEILERVAKLDETRWYLTGCKLGHSGVGIQDPSVERSRKH